MIAENLVVLREALKKNKNQFADFLGVANSYITRYEQGSTEPGLKFFSLLKEKIPLLDLNWLLTGKGSIFVSELTNKELVKENADLKKKILDYKEGIQNVKDAFKALDKL